jgi:hypothetical protein
MKPPHHSHTSVHSHRLEAMRWTRVAVLVLALGVVAGWGAVASGNQAPGVVTQTPEEAAATSLAAAAIIFDADPDPACEVGQPRVCVHPSSTPEQAARGIARFGVSGSGPEGQGGYLGILGRTPAGDWEFWFGTQNIVYQLLNLPGQMIVCAGGDALNVRALPSLDGAILATLPDLTHVTAEQFALTHPGVEPTATTDQLAGSGWYYLSVPVAGWASSLYLTDAEVDAQTNMPPCALRDIFVQP